MTNITLILALAASILGTARATAQSNESGAGNPFETLKSSSRPLSAAASKDRIVKFRGHKDQVWQIEFSPDGLIAFSVGRDGHAALWSLPDAVPLANVLVADYWTAAFDTDSDQIVFALPSSNGLSAFSLKDQTIGPFSGSLGMEPPRMGGSGKAGVSRLAVQSGTLACLAADRLELFDIRAGRVLSKHKIKDGRKLFALSPNGRMVATGYTIGSPEYEFDSERTILSLYTVTDQKEPRVLTLTDQNVNEVRFSPDSKIVATSSGGPLVFIEKVGDRHVEVRREYPGILRLWNVDTLTCITTFDGFSESVMSADISHDGNCLLLCSGNSIRLIDMKSNQVKQTYEGHDERVFVARFAPDDRHVISGDSAGWLHFWPVASEEMK